VITITFRPAKQLLKAHSMPAEFLDPETRQQRQRVIRSILGELETVIAEAQAATRPLEIEPWRSRLFATFVQAWQNQLIPDESSSAAFDDADEDDPDLELSADSLCRILARRSGLDLAAREAQTLQTKLPPDQLERMRLLWSLMRMWMEWSYAWLRWNEQHPPQDEQQEQGTEEHGPQE
jgi:hypothetical protein